MTPLGWAFMLSIWTIVSCLTVWCFTLILKPDARPNQADLPPSGRM